MDVIRALKSQEQFAIGTTKAEGRSAPWGTNWLASHPSNDKRLAGIQEIAATYAGHYVNDGHARHLRAINGMAFGETRVQGVTRGRNFYHEDLGFAQAAPAGWRVANAADAITPINGTGDAGSIVKLVPPQAGQTHEDVIRQLLIKPIDRQTEHRTINGLSATH